MSCKSCFLVLTLSFFMIACANDRWKSSEVDEVFITDIKSSGIKIFNYSLTKASAQASGGGGSKGNGRGGGKGKGSGKHGGSGGKGGGKSAGESSLKPYFTEMLESKLKESGYCRKGYIELSSSFGRGRLQMRGECEEGATEDDHIKFANNKSI